MQQRPRTPFWLLLNVLSLDAPLVCLVWQDFLARCYPFPLSAAARWVLGLTTWTIYLADRLLDARQPAPPNEPARHRFYRRKFSRCLALAAAVLTADLVIAFRDLRREVLLTGVGIAAGVLLYLAVFPLLRIGSKHWKKLSAAALFTAGVFFAAWTRVPVVAPAFAAGSVCLANLILVERWEQGRPVRRFWIGMALIAGGCLWWGHNRWYWAIAMSAVALALLSRAGSRWDSEARHVLADAAMLTPLLFL
jgi:hypothetical protein